MLTGSLVVWSLAGIVAAYAHSRDPSLHRVAVPYAWRQLRSIAVQVPLTILAASYILTMLPKEQIAALLGGSSGAQGVLLASVIGAGLPGGPMVTFPVLVVLRDHGVGDAQTVALLTAWSVMALHRIFAFELGLLGTRFVAVRVAASAPLPLIAGFAASGWWMLAA